MRIRRIKEKGFTLFEVLIAITILGIVLTTVYGAYTGTLRIVKDTKYSDTVYGMARSTMKRITEDLQSTCRYKGGFTFQSKDQERFEEDVMELTFISSQHLNFVDDSGGIAEISYYAVEDKEGGGYLLMRKDVLQAEQREEEELDALSPAIGYILCEKLQSLRYRFFDGRGEEHDSWDSASDTNEQKGRAPAIVSVELDFINPDDDERPYRFATKVFLPLTGEGQNAEAE